MLTIQNADSPPLEARLRIRSEALVLVLAAACGGSGPTSSGGGGNPPAGGQAVQVSMTEYRFTPDTVRIAVGTAVRWSNDGVTDHTTTSDSVGGWNSGALAPPQPPATCPYPPCNNTPGGSFQVTFTAPGTYGYHCSFHGVPGPGYHGMIGTIIVTP